MSISENWGKNSFVVRPEDKRNSPSEMPLDVSGPKTADLNTVDTINGKILDEFDSKVLSSINLRLYMDTIEPNKVKIYKFLQLDVAA